MFKLVKWIGGTLVTVAAVCAPLAAQAQGSGDKPWPTKPFRVVVPFPAGGSQDLMGRLLATELEKAFGNTAVVENISGGATVPAALSILNDRPNGYALFVASDTTLNINQHVFKNPKYDGTKDFYPVTVLNTFPHWLLVRKDAPFNNIDDLKKYIQDNPGKASISVNSVGGTAHLGLSKWRKNNNLDFEIVPYRGSAPANTDLIGGHTTAHVDTLGATVGFVKEGRTKPLAILQKKPIPQFVDVMSQDPADPGALIVEVNVSVVVHKDTPRPIVQKLYDAIKDGAQTKAFQQRMDELAFQTVLTDPETSAQFLRSETQRYGDLFKISGLPQQ